MAIVINGSTGISATESSTVLGDNAVETADIAAGAVTAAKLASTLDLTGKTVTLPAGVGGKVLQVVSTTKTDTFSFSLNSTWYEITGLNATITPSSSSSKIYIEVSFMMGVTSADQLSGYRITRSIGGGSWTVPTGSTNTPGGGATSIQFMTAGQRANFDINGAVQIPLLFLDSPATTSSVQYRIEGYGTQGGTAYINRTALDSASYPCRGVATITLTEIAA